MEQIIVNVIVAAAFLFLARWLYKSFAASRREKKTPSCGSCSECAPAPDAPTVASAKK